MKIEGSPGGFEIGFFILTPAAFSSRRFLLATLKNLSQTTRSFSLGHARLTVHLLPRAPPTPPPSLKMGEKQ